MYNLHSVHETCVLHALPSRFVTPLELEVAIYPDAILVFANVDEENDTYLGFRDTPWHSHGKFLLMTGESTYLQYDPTELVIAIAKGDVLIVSQPIGNRLKDRWLMHKEERLDLQYIEPDETLSVCSLPSRS